MPNLQKTIWIICLIIIFVVSIGFCLRMYNTTYDLCTAFFPFKEYIQGEVNRHMANYTIIQVIDFTILIYINLIGHFIDYIKGRGNRIHFYGITNIVIYFTMILVDIFKYQKEYRFICYDIQEKIIPISNIIGIVALINCLGYIFMIIRNIKKEKKKMNISKEEEKEFDQEMKRWMLEKTVDLTKNCNEKDFETLKKLKVEYENPLCSEFQFGILLRRVYEYYDFEELKNKDKLTYYEKNLLEDFLWEKALIKKCVRQGYLRDEQEEKKLEDVGISKEEYKMLLTKLENINMEIKIKKQIRRIEKK